LFAICQFFKNLFYVRIFIEPRSAAPISPLEFSIINIFSKRKGAIKMGYYNNNNRNHYKNNSHKPRQGQNYVWVVYNLKHGRYHSFASKVQALKYYYDHDLDCCFPEKRGG
jgi:hypothetical protein